MRVARELLKQRAVCACVLSERDAVRAVRARVQAPDGPFAESLGRRAWLLGLLERCQPGAGAESH